MVNIFPDFQPDGPGWVLGEVRCVRILSCVVSGSGPDILLIIYSGRLAILYLSSVLVHSLLLLYRKLTHGHLVLSPGECKSFIGGRINTRKRKEEKE